MNAFDSETRRLRIELAATRGVLDDALRIEARYGADILILEQLAYGLGLTASEKPDGASVESLTATLHRAAQTDRIMRALLRKLGGQAQLTADELNAPRNNMATHIDGDGSMWMSIGPTPIADEPPTPEAAVLNEDDWKPGKPVHTPPTPTTCTNCGTTWDADIDTCPECNATSEKTTTTN